MKCSFCKEEIEKGTGKMFVKADAKVFYFCSRRCEKNLLKLKRDPTNVKWVKKKKVTSKK